MTETCSRCGLDIPSDAPNGICPRCLLTEGLAAFDEGESPGSLRRNENLLFAVFAVQLRKASPKNIMSAAAEWASDPSKDLPKRLVENRAISHRDKEMIERLVREAIAAHDGDAEETLRSFGGARQVEESLQGAIIIGPTGWLPSPGGKPAKEAKGKNGSGSASVMIPDSSMPTIHELPGRYEERSVHARGGQGRLLIVHDEELGRDVIMKELLEFKDTPDEPLTPLRRSAGMISRFLQEARVTGQLEHPAIVPVYELGRRSDGKLYYTMKLVRGMSLEQRLAKCSGLRDRLRLLPHFLDLCQGVAYAHSRGVVHRDLKPQNVMVGEFGETVVIDWGLAKLRTQNKDSAGDISHRLDALRHEHGEKTPTFTMHGELMGTPIYMAPEQARGNLGAVDERSDIYALGAILYKILSGTTIFEWTTLDDVIQKVRHEHPRRIEVQEPEVPLELAAICERCIDKDPSARYQTAKELADDISRFQAGALVAAYDYKLPELVKRFYRRHKSVVNVGLTAVAALIAVIAYSYVQVVESRNDAVIARSVAEKQTYITQVRLAQSQIDAEQFDDAHRTLEQADPQQRNWEWGYLVNQSRQALLVLNDAADATFSPDRRFVATTAPRQPMKIWDAESGTVLRTFGIESSTANDVQFSPDGSAIVTIGIDNKPRIWDPVSTEPLAVLEGHTGDLVRMAISPTGDRLVTTATDGLVPVWAIPSGEMLLKHQPHPAGSSDAKFSADGQLIASIGRRFVGEVGNQRTVTEVAVWRADSGQELFRIPADMYDLSHDGGRLAIALGASASVVSITGESAPVLLPAPNFRILFPTFNPDGTLVATTSEDGFMRVYDSYTGDLIHELLHGATVNAATFSNDGKVIMSFSLNGLIAVWDLVSGARITTSRGHAESIREVAFSADDARLLSGSFDQTVRIWDTYGSGAAHTIATLGEKVDTAGFAGTADVAFAGTPSGIHLINTITGEKSCTIEIESRLPSMPTAISANGAVLALVGDGFSAAVFDLANHELLSVFNGHTGPITAIAINATGELVATGSWDRSVYLWNAGTGAVTHRFEGLASSVTALTFDNAGHRLAAGGQGGEIVLWELGNPQPIGRLDPEAGEIADLAFSRTGESLFVAGAKDGVVHLDIKSGRIQARFQGQFATTPSFTVDDMTGRIVTAATDSSRSGRDSLSSSLRCWDAMSGEQFVTIRDVPGSVLGLAFRRESGGSTTSAFRPQQLLAITADGLFTAWDGTRADSQPAEQARLTRLHATLQEQAPTRIALIRDDTLIARWATYVDREQQDGRNETGSDGVTWPNPDDTILDKAITSGTNNFDKPHEAIASNAGSPAAQPVTAALSFQRNGRDHLVKYIALKPAIRDVEVAISRNEASRTLAILSKMISDNRVLLEEARRKVGGSGSEFMGMRLPGGYTSDLDPHFGLLGLSPGDLLITIDNTGVDGVDTLYESVERLLGIVNDPAGHGFALCVQRGNFLTVNITVSVHDGML